MKKLISIYLIAATLLGLNGCKDFLDNPPQGVQNTDNFYSNEKEATQGLMAAYFWLSGDDWWYRDVHHTFGDVCSDNAFDGWNDQLQYTLISNFTWTPQNEYNENNWAFAYKGIYTANMVIDRVPKANISDENFKNQIIAEAQFLRAFQYFGLVRNYGGVILMEHESTEEDFSKGRSTEEETWDLIEADLLAAIPNLPYKSDQASDEVGRVTRGTAEGILAKVYVYRQKWQEAYEMVKAIETKGDYQLIALKDLWNGANRNGAESLFELQTSNDPSFYLGSSFPLWSGSRNESNFSGVEIASSYGWGFNTPSSHLDNAFTTADGSEDPRRPFTIIRQNDKIDLEGNPDPNGWAYNNFIGDDTDGSNPSGRMSRKHFLNPSLRTGDWIQDPYQYKYLRYADVLLLGAEAAYRIGNEGEARRLANLVRMRAWNDPAQSITSSGAQLLIDLKLERRLELAMEGERFYDLKRWGDVQSALQAFVEYNNSGANTDYDAGHQKGSLFNPQVHMLFPIPQNQMDLSNGAVDQNPGY